MEFTFTEEQEMFRQMVRDFAGRELKPSAAENDRKGELPERLIERARELGLFGVLFGELGEIGYCILMEELGRADNSFAGFIGGHEGLGSMGIHKFGSEAQKNKYMPKLESGEWIACYALSEPNAGSDAQNLQTTAVKKGSNWILNGQKVWITNADRADVILAFAANDRALRARGGISAFIVEKKFKGVRVGKLDEKMGLRAMHSPELFFEECEVPEENVVGPVGEGFKVAMGILDVGRISLGAMCVGTAKECVDLATRYAQQRVTFGKPIIEHQAVQLMLAEMATLTYSMETLVYRTAWMLDRGERVTREAAIAKYYCTESVSKVIDMAIQIHGGMGYMSELPLERFYRDARVNRIFEGTNEIQRIVIARDLQKKGGY
jgi:acyl-CoA dehydrogenase